jgi:tetratricopeptide (TPR) repeat protein
MPLHNCRVRLGLIVLCLGGLLGRPALAAPEAPWRRALTGADAKRVQELEQKVNALKTAGRFAEAEKPAREIVAVRTRAQGAGHWQTADANRQVHDLMQLATLPAEDRAALTAAGEHQAEGERLWRQGRYAQAEASCRKALAIHRRVLGEAHPATARSYSDVALNLDQQGRYAAAEPLHRKALAICRDVLGETHPNTAACYSNVAGNLNGQGQYAAAEPLFRKALVICRDVRGEAHPDTAQNYSNLAANLQAQGQYAAAEPLFRKALAICRKVLGETDPATASGYHNVAAILDDQGQHAAAEPLFRKALAIRQKALGETHPDTAQSYNAVAVNLNAQGRYADAEPLFRQALAIRRKVLGEAHPATAQSYHNVAMNLNAQGQYAAAGPLLRQALAIRRKVLGEAHPATAQSYHDVAFNLDAQGQYAEAEPLCRKALALRQTVLGDDHPDTASSSSNLAYNLTAQGKYAEAEPLCRQALAIQQKVLGEQHPQTALGYNNVAAILELQGKHAEAEPLARKALAVRQKALGELHPHTAQSYLNLAGIVKAQGRYADAEPLYRKALAICREVLGEAHPDTALGYHGLAVDLQAQGNYREAETLWRTAARSFEAARLGISFTGLERATFATERSPLPRLAACLARTGQAAEAWTFWEANLARGLFDDLSARRARALSEKERRRAQELTAAVQLLDKQIATLAQVKDWTDAQRRQLDQLHQRRDAGTVVVAEFEAELARTHGPVAGQVYDLAAIQKQLPADAALLGWLDRKGLPQAADPDGEHWACLVRRRGAPVWVRLAGSGPKAAWTAADDALPGRVRELLVEQPKEEAAAWRDPAGRLYAQRLAPLAPHLAATPDLPAVRHLIVLPSPALAGVPVEALVEARTDRQPAYTVSYAPSGTLFAWLQEQRARGHKPAPHRLLALGDPTFAPPAGPKVSLPLPPDHGVLLTDVLPGLNADKSGLKPQDVLLRYAGIKLTAPADLTAALARSSGSEPIPVQVWRHGQTLDLVVRPGKLGIVSSKQPAAETIRGEREFAVLMQQTRGRPFTRLPGTRREVEAIARLFAQADTLLGSRASEQQLDQLLASGRLRDYSILHLATHGVLDPRIALHSALILSQDALPDPLQQALAGKEAYDGRLTAAQILRTWKLDADLVTLSACQSGLGQHQGGEGYLGFAQALLLAGGRSLVLSLWQVDDNATALLMTRFYQNLLGKRKGLDKPLPKAEALAEAKVWLRGLTAKDVDHELAQLPRGAEVERPPAPVTKAEHPYGHPYYWAAFVLIGDPR